jgi:hypothetical protein
VTVVTGTVTGGGRLAFAELDADLADAVRDLHWEGLGGFWNPLFERALDDA